MDPPYGNPRMAGIYGPRVPTNVNKWHKAELGTKGTQTEEATYMASMAEALAVCVLN